MSKKNISDKDNMINSFIKKDEGRKIKPATSTPTKEKVEFVKAETKFSQSAVDVMTEPTSQNIQHQLTEDAKKQKEYFEKQPKVIMNLPLKDGEVRGSYESVCVNGYRLQIPKGVSVKLPSGVAEILADFYNIQLGNGAIPEEIASSVNRDSNSMEALS